MSDASRAATEHSEAGLRHVWWGLVRLTERLMGEPRGSTEGGYSVRGQDWTPTAGGMTLAEVQDALGHIDEDAMRKAQESLGGAGRTR
ncbi:hypothetical protein [Actinacidiphila reveromycinica]|nr:hypothetical protein [Streptomyces sp. SN-593]